MCDRHGFDDNSKNGYGRFSFETGCKCVAVEFRSLALTHVNVGGPKALRFIKNCYFHWAVSIDWSKAPTNSCWYVMVLLVLFCACW